MSKRPLCPQPDQPPYGHSGVAADLSKAVGFLAGTSGLFRTLPLVLTLPSGVLNARTAALYNEVLTLPGGPRTLGSTRANSISRTSKRTRQAVEWPLAANALEQD